MRSRLRTTGLLVAVILISGSLVVQAAHARPDDEATASVAKARSALIADCTGESAGSTVTWPADAVETLPRSPKRGYAESITLLPSETPVRERDCQQRADSTLRTTGLGLGLRAAAIKRAQQVNDVMASAAVQNATDQWRACMTDLGYEYASPAELRHRSSVLDATDATSTYLAGLDAGCQQSTGYRSVVRDALEASAGSALPAADHKAWRAAARAAGRVLETR